MPDEFAVSSKFLSSLSTRAGDLRTQLDTIQKQREDYTNELMQLSSQVRPTEQQQSGWRRTLYNIETALSPQVAATRAVSQMRTNIDNEEVLAAQARSDEIKIELDRLSVEQKRVENLLSAVVSVEHIALNPGTAVKDFDTLKAMIQAEHGDGYFTADDWASLEDLYQSKKPAPVMITDATGQPVPNLDSLTQEERDALISKLTQRYTPAEEYTAQPIRPQVNITSMQGKLNPELIQVVVDQNTISDMITSSASAQSAMIENMSGPLADFAAESGDEIYSVLEKLREGKYTYPEFKRSLDKVERNVDSIKQTITELEDKGEYDSATRLKRALVSYENLQDFFSKLATSPNLQIQGVKKIEPDTRYEMPQQSVDAIMNAFSVGDEDLIEAMDIPITPSQMLDIFGLDVNELTDENLIEIVHNMGEVYATNEAYRQGLAEFKIEPLTFLDKFKLAATQPALASYELVQWYVENFSKPWSGMITLKTYEYFSKDRNSIIRQMKDEAVADGLSNWQSFGEVHDVERYAELYEEATGKKLSPAQYGTRFGGMLAAELLLDPTTYIGWKAVSNVAMHLGPAGRFVARMNNGFIKFTDDAAIIALSNIKRGISKGMTKLGIVNKKQMISAAAEQMMLETNAALARALKENNLAHWSPADVAREAKAMRDAVLTNPDMAGTSVGAKFGQAQLMANPIEVSDLADMIRKVKGTAPDNATMIDINNAFFEMKYKSAIDGFSKEDTATNVIRLLDGEVSDDTIKYVADFFKAKGDSEIAVVDAIFASDTTADILKKFKSHIYNRLSAQIESKVTTAGLVNSKTYKFMNWLNEKNLLAGFSFIDKQVTIPMARLVLVHPAYGPMNVNEVAMKAAMRGYNVIPDMVGGYGQIRLYQWMAGDLSNGVQEVMNYTVRQEGTLMTNAGDMFLRKPNDSIPLIERAYNATPGWGKPLGEEGKFGGRLGKWLRKKHIPTSAEEWQESTARLQSNMRASYLNQEYLYQLGLIDVNRTKIAKELRKTFETDTALLREFNKQELAEMGEMLEAAILSGPDHVRSLAKTNTTFKQTKIALKVDELFGNHPTVPHYILESMRHEFVEGKGMSAIDDVIDNAIATFQDDYVFKTFAKSHELKNHVDGLLGMEIKTADDANAAIKMLNDLTNGYIQDVSDIRIAMTRRAQNMTNTEVKQAYHEEGLSRLYEFMDEIDEALSKSGDKIAATNLEGLSKANAPSLKNLTQIYKDMIGNTRTARQQTQAIFNNTLAAHGGKRSDAFWSEVLQRMNSEWDLALGKNRKLFEARDKIMLQLTHQGYNYFPKAGGELVVGHVAGALNLNVDDIAGSVIRAESHTVMPKEDWINMIRSRLQAQADLANADLVKHGYTDAGLERCYDDIVRSMNFDPNTVHPLAPTFASFGDIRMQMKQIKSVSGLSEGGLKRWNELIEEMAVHSGGEVTATEEAQKFASNFSTKVRISSSRTRVVEARTPSGTFAGRIDISTREKYTVLENLDVLEDYRLQGLAKRLQTEAIFEAEKIGKPVVTEKVTEGGRSVIESLAKSGDINITPLEGLTDVGGGVKISTSYLVSSKGKLPPVQEGYTRLYRYGIAQEDEMAEAGRWFTQDLTEAETFGKSTLGSKLRYVDVPTPDLPKFKPSDEGNYLYLPKDLAKKSTFAPTAAKAQEGVSFSITEREAAMEAARKQYGIEFADYTPNAFNGLMKKLYPFWSYEAHRWAWIGRQIIQKPSLLHFYGKYMEVSDRGRIRIPGTDWSINPLVGTIFGGGFRRLFLQDRPEYWDRFPEFSSSLDMGMRFGFYPSSAYNLIMSMVGTGSGRRPDLADVMPPIISGPLDLFVARHPESKAAKNLLETIFSSNYRDYYIVLDLNGRGIDGEIINAKRRQGIELSETEQRHWDEATGRTSWFRFANTIAGNILALTPEDKQLTYDLAKQVKADITGITDEQQQQISDLSGVSGKTFSYYRPLDPLEQNVLSELTNISAWASSYTSLKPSLQQEVETRIQLYWNESENIWDIGRQGGTYENWTLPKTSLPLEEADIRLQNYFANNDQPKLNPDQWINNYYSVMDWAVTSTKALANSEYYKDLPLSLLDEVDENGNIIREGRVTYYKENAIPYFFSPTSELLWHYRQIKPEAKDDPDLNWATDWDSYFAQTRGLVNAVPEQYRQRFLDNMQMNMTDYQRLFWAVNETYLRPYKNVKNVILESYTPEQQSVIKQIPLATPEEMKRLKNILAPDDKRVIVLTSEQYASMQATLAEDDLHGRRFLAMDEDRVESFIEGLTPQELDSKFRTLTTGEKAALKSTSRSRFLESMSDEDKKLYSSFDAKVRQARLNLRTTNPELDAWLIAFGTVTTWLTEDGEAAYKSLAKDLGSGNLEPYIGDLYNKIVYKTPNTTTKEEK